MARLHYVKAGKDYPQHNIKKGEMHWTWTPYRQPTRRSKTRPSRSQMATSDFKVSFYDMVDSVLPDCDSKEALETLANDVEQLAEEERGKIDELPENFQNGPLGEKYNNRADELETWRDEINDAASDLGEEKDFKPEEDGHATYAEKLASIIEDLQSSAPDPE